MNPGPRDASQSWAPHPHPPGSHTLPKGEEDDGFNGEELEYWLEGSQEVPGGEVEKEQSVESQANGGVVHEGHIQVAAVDAGPENCRLEWSLLLMDILFTCPLSGWAAQPSPQGLRRYQWAQRLGAWSSFCQE